MFLKCWFFYYRITGSNIFPEKALVDNCNVPFVWNHPKESRCCIVSNDCVLNLLLYAYTNVA